MAAPLARPPARMGMPASLHHVPARCSHPLLVDYLAAQFPHVPTQTWRQRLQQGAVLDAQHQPLPPDAPCVPRAILWYYREPAQETRVPFQAQVLYRDAELIVADKPHFLPVIPGGRHARETLLVRLQQELGLPQLAPLHRLDRETAGLVLLSPQPGPARQAYLELFRTHKVHKLYHAIAADRPALQQPQLHSSRLRPHHQDFFRMEEVPGTANSLTRIERLRPLRQGLALYALQPHTGQRHQLRVHMQALGLPIVGDQFYPQVLRGPHEPEDFSQPLQLLACTLQFDDPVSGQAQHFCSRQQLAAGRQD